MVSVSNRLILVVVPIPCLLWHRSQKPQMAMEYCDRLYDEDHPELKQIFLLLVKVHVKPDPSLDPSGLLVGSPCLLASPRLAPHGLRVNTSLDLSSQHAWILAVVSWTPFRSRAT